MLVLNLIIHHKLNTSYNRAQYKLQQSTVQVTIEHNTSYNRAQYKLQQSTVQVTIEHNTSYNRPQYKLQQSTTQVTIEHNTSYNRAQYKLQQSTVQVTIEHNTIYNRAQHKLQQSTIQDSCTCTVNGGAQIVCRQPLDTCYYNGEQLIKQPRSKCLWGLLHMRHVILRSCEYRHLLRKHHTTYCNDNSIQLWKKIHRYHLLKCVDIFLADSIHIIMSYFYRPDNWDKVAQQTVIYGLML